MTPNDSNKLEALISQAVKGLPPRPAPRSLESRVMAEIERRARLPWYQRSFRHWPVAARGVFLVASAAAAAVLTLAVVQFFGMAPTAVQPYADNARSWYDGLRTAGQSLSHVVSDTFHSVPSFWLYGAAAIVAGSYAALVGIGTFAYRAARNR